MFIEPFGCLHANLRLGLGFVCITAVRIFLSCLDEWGYVNTEKMLSCLKNRLCHETSIKQDVQGSHTCSNKAWKYPALSELHHILLLPELLQDGDAARPGCGRGGVLGVVTVPATVKNTTVFIIEVCLKTRHGLSTAMKIKTSVLALP